MNIYIKPLGGFVTEVWIEIPNSSSPDLFEVVCEARVIDTDESFIVDEIYTKAEYRRRGYARALIKKLQSIKTVIPFAISSTVEATSFWDSLGMGDLEDGARPEIAKALEQMNNVEFNHKIEENV